MTNIPNNELIAKYLGFQKGHPTDPNPKLKDDWFEPDGTRHSILHFDSSWAWIMPAFHKCIYESQFMDPSLRKGLLDGVSAGTIEELHTAIVEFLKKKKKK